MEDIDGLLRTNICNILNSVSCETVNGVINAVKAAGVASLYDLQYVKEKDLFLVLDPIQQQQLITAWSKQSVDCDEIRQSIKKEKVDPPAPAIEGSGLRKWYSKLDDIINSVDCDQIRQDIKKENVDPSAPSSENSGDVTKLDDLINSTLPTKLSSLPWNREKHFVLLEVYTKYKTEFSCPDVEKQEVWKKIAGEVREKCFFNCDEDQCHNYLVEQRQLYENLKNRPPTSLKIAVFLDLGKNAFEAAENLGASTSETSNNLSSQRWDGEKQRVLMQVYAKYKTEFDSSSAVERRKVWRKIADEVRQQCSLNLNNRVCWSWREILKSQYINIETKHLDKHNNDFKKEAEEAFEPLKSGTSAAGTSNNLTSKKRRWNCNKRNVLLLQLYTKYKTELDSCPSSENLTVWRKIADEFQQQCSFIYSDKECRLKILEMKSRYRINKTKLKKLKTRFMKEAEKTFGPLKSVNFSTEKSSNIHLEQQNRSCQKILLKPSGEKRQNFNLLLLQLYGKYKTGIDSPDHEIQSVWKNIATEMREIFLYACNDLMCRSDVIELKRSYEYFKLNPQHQSVPYYFDAAQQVFENSVYPANFSAGQSSNIHLEQMRRRYEFTLLQLYGKYKTGVACPDLEELCVWERIATEMRESFFNCTHLQCRSDVIQMKYNYEMLKVYPHMMMMEMPHYFDAARQVFEFSVNPGHNICNFPTNDYVVNTSASTYQITTKETPMDGNFPVRVSNLPKKVADTNLRRLFRRCGKFNHYYVPRDRSGNCKGFAFISYHRLKEAQQALQYNGYNYNNSFLKVKLADPSEISGFSER